VAITVGVAVVGGAIAARRDSTLLGMPRVSAHFLWAPCCSYVDDVVSLGGTCRGRVRPRQWENILIFERSMSTTRLRRYTSRRSQSLAHPPLVLVSGTEFAEPDRLSSTCATSCPLPRTNDRSLLQPLSALLFCALLPVVSKQSWRRTPRLPGTARGMTVDGGLARRGGLPLLHEPLAHTPFVLKRGDGRLVGQGSPFGTARRTGPFAGTARIKRE
jgi:hypothetical protein